MALDISALSNKEAVTAIYVGYFNRAPDPEGLQYWIDELEAGNLTLAGIATSFSEQPETTALYPFFSTPDVASATAFVTSVYLNLFNRAPDAAGLNYWVGEVQANADSAGLGQVILNIISGAQGDDITIVNNKIKAGCDFAQDLAAASLLEFDDGNNDAAELAAAKDVLSGVDETDASVTAAAAKTDTFVSEATNTAPVATAAAGTTDEDITLNGTLAAAATDADGDALTFSLATGATSGVATVNADGTYSYVPNADFNGSDSFTYTVEDGRGGSSTETVTITVDAVNDDPVAADSATSTPEDASVNGSVSATDVDGDSLVYSVAAADQPANGSVAMNADGTYVYTPNADFNGADTFTFTVSDGNGGSTTGEVTVTVNPVNDAPVGTTPASFTGNEDAPSIAGAVTATDVDGDTLSYTQATNPTNGAVTVNADGTFSYTPNADFNGVDTFDVTVSDGTASITETVTINVLPVNDDPVAADLAGSTFEDVDFVGQVSATDVDAGDTAVFTAAQPVTGGTVSMNPDGSFTMEPTPNFSGTVTFDYTVTDGGGLTDTGTVTIVVTPVDDVLTVAIDVIAGSSAADVVLGTEATLNGSDSVDGADGDDLVFITTEGNANEAGFILKNVEEFRVTAEGDGSDDAVFDLSSSDDIELLSNTNSTANVEFLQANMIADADGDGRAEVNLSIFNATNDVDTTLSVRDGDLTGNDEANVRIVSGDASFQDVDNLDIDSDLGHIDLFIEGAVGIRDIDSGNTTMTITQDASSSLVIDDDIPSSINFVDARSTADGGMNGSSTGSAGSIDFDFSNSTSGAGIGGNGATFHGGTGADDVDGGDNNDLLMGYAGNDNLDGNDGNDSIDGGEGNDDLAGDAGSDTLLGGDDNDTIDGGADSDSILGGDGDDQINTGTGAGVETVDGGEGSDTVTTLADQLIGRAVAGSSTVNVDQLSGGTDGAGPDGALHDQLNVVGNSTDANGLNDVQQFEQINLSGGTHVYTIGNNSVFENDHDGGTSGGTIINGRAATSVNINASTLDLGIGLVGSVNADTLIGGDGDDMISGYGSITNATGGNDVMMGNDGDDTFVTDARELDGNDTIDGGADNDTISIEYRGGTAGNGAHLGADISNVENLVVAQTYSALTANAHGSQNYGNTPNLDFHLFLDTNFNNSADNNTLNIDATAMDTASEDFIFESNTNFAVTLNIQSGAGADVFAMRDDLGAADVIDGGDGEDTLSISVNAGGDADFTGVTNVECLVLEAGFAGTLTLGAEAFEAGFTKIDASAVTGNFTIDASAFGGPLTIIDSTNPASNSTITGTAFDDTIVAGEGTDVTNGGGGNDVLQVNANDLDATDTLNGVETVTLMNNSDTSNIAAVINLDNVTGLEMVNVEGNGVEPGGNVGNADSVTFQGGNVGTVTEITIDTSARTDPSDSFSVIIDGADNPGGAQPDVDADYAFTITGGAGNVSDSLFKFNQGINNNINWDGGAGNDFVSIFAGDLGASTTINGGDGFDRLIQLENGVAFTDDDFSNVTNMEEIQADSGATAAVLATLGVKADAAGIGAIDGGSGNDNVTIDAAFDNALFVDLENGGDDTINAGASAAMLTVEMDFPDLTAADFLTGGTGNMDTLNLHVGNGTADATNVNGFDIINVTESNGGPGTLILGTQNTALTINENTGNPFDNETFNLEAENYLGDITFNGHTNPGDGANGTLTTGAGNDNINAGNFNDTVIANGGNDTVDGGAGADSVEGGAGNDSIMGGTGNDTLDGGADNDTIDGGANDDIITGGAGSDSLTGGDGADSFRYVNVSDSAGGVSLRDVITDFDVLLDTICIEESMLQEFAGVTGIQFVGTEEFFSDAQGTVSLAANVGNGLADIVFESGLNKLWIDIDDNGILNGQDVQITLDGVTTGLTNANFKAVDTVSPDAPTISMVTVDSTDGAPGNDADFITNDNTAPVVRVAFSTAADGSGAAEGDTLTLNGTPGATAPVSPYTLTAVDIANGYVDFTLDAGPIADGTYTLTSFVTDTFGIVQVGATSDAVDLVIDTTATIAITVPIEGDNIINAAEDADVLVAGTTTGVEEGQEVTIEFNGGNTVTATVDAGGNWTLLGSEVDLSGLADGAITVTADVTDKAGNVAVQATAPVTKDTAATINITGLNNETTVDNIVDGAEDTGGAITIQGTVTDVEDGVGRVGISITSPSNVVVPGLNVDVVAGAWETGPLGPNFFSEDGTYTINVTTTDDAGNTATSSFDFEVDETGPVYTVSSVVYDEGTGAGDGTITVNGTFDPTDIDVIDVTMTNWNDDGVLIPVGPADFVSVDPGVVASTTAITLAWAPGAQATFEGAVDVASSTVDTLDINAGVLVDALGNLSAATSSETITYIVSTDVQGREDLFGNGGDDTLTANSGDGDFAGAGVELTGGAGADTFVITDGGDGFGIALDGNDGLAILDFNATDGDMIVFDASDLNAFGGIPFGGAYGAGDDGSEIAFRSYIEDGNGDNGDAVAATTFAGTIIFDAVNERLLVDTDGDTSFNGFAVLNTADDIIIDLTGVSGLVTAADIGFIA